MNLDSKKVVEKTKEKLEDYISTQVVDLMNVETMIEVYEKATTRLSLKKELTEMETKYKEQINNKLIELREALQIKKDIADVTRTKIKSMEDFTL